MDLVTHNGITYKKASAVAKEFKYTTDYIGQLCRAKKIDARLVGRAWYVNPESLTGHKKGRYQTESPAEDVVAIKINKLPEEAPKKYLKRVSIEPVLANKTVKILKHFGDSSREVNVKYESDGGSLIPKMIKNDVSTDIKIDLAEGEDLPVETEKTSVKPTILRPEPLPIVYLKGKLPVTDIPEKATLPVVEADRQEHVIQHKSLGTVALKPPEPRLTNPLHNRRTVENITRDKPIEHSHASNLRPVSGHSSVPQRFSPQSVPNQSKVSKAIKHGNEKPSVAPKPVSKLLLVTLYLSAFLVAGLIITAELTMSVTKVQVTEKIDFKVDKFLEILE